ncbi:DeoR/GlpR family DNA-binding transcription regulator [Amycolatopsis thailandensis]|uniref:DeoR/GlpR family DNA-binding transcription regulator n=1 Tax=Amycolatopsis thailandensis TaxID=589330 RepID=UPI00363819AC
MRAEERRRLILDRVWRDGSVGVTGLAAELEVAAETIRRDLTVLAGQGVLRRVHGGAILDARFESEPSVEIRRIHMTAEKGLIAQAALDHVPPEGTVLLDAGTTTACLAALLPSDRELTIVTHAVDVALALARRSNLTVLLVGGRIRRRTLASVDAWAIHALAEICVDVAFIGTNGLSLEHGLTTPDSAEAMVKRSAIAAAGHSIVLADHTKVGKSHFARFAALSDIDVVITSGGVDSATVAEIDATGPRVIVA